MNGILRKLTDLDFINYIKKYDIVLVSETWVSKKDHLNLDIQGYTSEHIPGNKSAGAKKGRYSGGISIFYKNFLKDKIQIVDKNQIGILWVKILKDVLVSDQDIYVGVNYVPPSGSAVLNREDIDISEQLELDIIKYKTLGRLYLVGDFNSRTSNLPDFIQFDRYLDDEDIFFIDSHIQTRVNKDHVSDVYGRRLIQLCQTPGLLIANGRVHDAV